MCARKQALEIPPHPNFQWEEELQTSGSLCIAGLDEAGRGAWAGPVFAAAVILAPSHESLSLLKGVRDSKQMTSLQRNFWAKQIKQHALAWAVGSTDQYVIDSSGIISATRMAMLSAISQLNLLPDHLLIDALLLPTHPTRQTSLIKGDQRSLSIAAASVLAKTARDQLMCEMDETYPGYGFALHKGYGTYRHATALQAHGACPLHRMTFKPLLAPIAWGSAK